MGRRVLPVALVLLAVVADRRGLLELGALLLVLAVPAAAGAALTVFGNLLALPPGARGVVFGWAEVVLGAFALVAVVVAAAARASAVEGAGVPPLAVSAVVACVTAFALQAFVALLAPERAPRPRERRPGSPEQAEPARAA